jgi:hypothetical protein
VTFTDIMTANSTLPTPETPIIDIISQYRETVKVFRRLEAQTGACICCQALFLPLRAASEQFGFEVEVVLADIKAAIHKRQHQGQPEEVSPSESASYEQTENQTD